MKTSILALAIALAFSSTTTPASAKATAQQKCDAGKQTASAKHQQCRTLAEAKNTKKPDPTKRTASQAKCDAKMGTMFAKFEGKTPEDGMAAAEDQCSNYGDFDNFLALNTAVSAAVADGSASEAGAAALSRFDCTKAAICAKWGELYPPEIVDGWPSWQNNYHGDTAESTGCDGSTWSLVQDFIAPCSASNGVLPAGALCDG